MPLVELQLQCSSQYIRYLFEVKLQVLNLAPLHSHANCSCAAYLKFLAMEDCNQFMINLIPFA